ncbi:MAG: aldehyde-activating protein [Hyperionvirus sp.]|uniref:Aldehyde-activating protein n=1 Tax=Hyperionvirus sp. TaxID=2487770 RepID=A0A3G5ADB6_9VIRU|nr:MAG: aldehyde-activating protein [Hyperionvirus sp.]
MVELECSCQCNKIKIPLNIKPTEIARCFCSICKDIYKTESTSFAVYPKKIVAHLESADVKIVRSPRAIRGFCNCCDSPLFMLYDDSPNVWIVTNILKFDITHIEIYDIFRKIEIPALCSSL